MKIAVIMGSPRKKDSYHICKEIEQRLNLYEANVEFDYIFLSEHDILDCKGCFICFQKSEKLCPCKNDSLESIKERLFSAQGIIIASPVYAYQVTGPLKCFIDRMSYLFHRQELFGKPAIIVVTTDGGGSKQVYRYLKMIISGWGMEAVGNLQIISPQYFKNRLPKSAFGYNEKYYDKKRKSLVMLSKKFDKRLSSTELRKPTFYDIFMFHCLRSKTYISAADRAYWEEKGWMKASYFYPVKMNPAKWFFGNIMRGIIHMVGKRFLENNK
ncbi:flavodoxin family protein [Anaerotignum sp. MB30-C6]|uniref:flavodoxin family protein n=1 Tax=Anaerotignum sp. MB30-C6 TaxID=3070814 RepID=UPI0027DE2765|nr:flavodoxin family protein [Anaerotignum sp. MB30-C6]WMI81171.1 flavodoxin family protein [Anaerotignum sp. MB30-C6]